MRALLLVAIASLGCSGDTPPNIDANPAGPACSKQVYDLCNEEHDCDSGLCRNFAAEGFQVCTQACGPGAPCPDDKSGNPGTCDAMGVCQPSGPNMCHL